MSLTDDIWHYAKQILRYGSPSEAIMVHCPRCGGSLKVSYDPASPQASGGFAGCLTVQCDTCHSSVSLDGLLIDPVFVELLGLEFATQARLNL